MRECHGRRLLWLLKNLRPLPSSDIEAPKLESLSPPPRNFRFAETAAGGLLGMRWSDIYLNKKIWTVPADRMKAAREHRVQLSPRRHG
jgi:hypothetical protein